MKTPFIRIIVLSIIVSLALNAFSQIGPPPTNFHQRPDINSFTVQEQQTLANLMLQYIDAQIITDHCDMRAITGGDIHSDFDFLPFHRAYLQGMEDFLVRQGSTQFVPLPS